MADLWKNNKPGIVIALVLIVVGSAYYFGAGLGTTMNSGAVPSKDIIEVLRSAQIKTAIADGNVLKLFVLSSSNALSKLRVDDGSSIPEENTIIIGSEEAKMMQEEKLFQISGDKLENLFGINTTVGGVLAKTDTVIDDMHFVSGEEFRQLNGDTRRVYVVLDEEGIPELHMMLKEDEITPVPFTFVEGDMSGYKTHDIVGVIYYPVVLGAQEAQMMRDEAEFKNIGDKLEIRGRKSIVVGILAKTGSALDMMHITPLDTDE